MKIITGMHRSGTSLVGKLFHDAGADMGNPDNFYRPDKWNPEGYYEQPDIHALNMPLINGPWWKFAYYRLPSTDTILRRSAKFEDQIRKTAGSYEGKIVKETRFCLTLPAWQRYDTEVDRVLICLRDPIQVAKSIQKRNYTLLRHGYYMWYLHTRNILEFTGNSIPVWVVYYHNLLDPETYLQEAEAAFRFMGMCPSHDTLKNLRENAVHTSMNHNPVTQQKYPVKIQALWETMKQRHARQFKH